MTSSPFRRCFVTSFVFGFFAVNTISAQMSAAAAAAAFRGSLVATAVPSPLPPYQGLFLQAIAIKWQPYPLENRYRILRAAAPSGPWVIDHEVVGVIDTVRRLPPLTLMYFRVVALRQVKTVAVKTVATVAWMEVDTTIVTATGTVRSTMVTGIGGLPENRVASIPSLCSVTPPSTVNLSWAHVPNANGYRLRIQLVSGPTSFGQPSVLVRDTAVVQTNVPTGHYTYIVEPQYDFVNWPGPGQTLSLYGPGLAQMDAIVGPGARCL
jgi:hypothetical protein